MLAAEAALVWRRETRAQLRATAYLASVVANNLPDADIVYTWITEPKPLGSLLHHRGHTHTVLVGLVMAGLFGLALARWVRRLPAAEERDTRLIFGLCLLGPLLHLLLDFGNNYGVHPFWPLTGRWFYGDSIFIIEPLWWAAAVPIVAQTVRRLWLRSVLWLLLGAVLVLTWFVPFVLPSVRLACLGLALGAWAVGRFTGERTRVAVAIAACALIAAVFSAGSSRAKSQLASATQAAFPALSARELVATPLPGNPACWDTFVVGEQGPDYLVLRATVALWPLAPQDCGTRLGEDPTALVRLLERPERQGVRWVSEYRAPLAQLRRLARDDCRFRALLEFARLPYYSEIGRSTPSRRPGKFAGDLRYDRQPELDFSDLELPADPHGGECPRWIPGWQPPRADLLLQP